MIARGASPSRDARLIPLETKTTIKSPVGMRIENSGVVMELRAFKLRKSAKDCSLRMYAKMQEKAEKSKEKKDAVEQRQLEEYYIEQRRIRREVMREAKKRKKALKKYKEVQP